MPNLLIHETSPYLRQHAHNPVHWMPWGEHALSLAVSQDKPILLSIGYAACHWCHVMEHQSFEDHKVADLMNKHFINIKVDREERPDIDMIYMDAVQQMGLQGGWPLNVFLTPDQKPFYGGTYFHKPSWMHLLDQIGHAWQQHRHELIDSAEGFAAGLQSREESKYGLREGHITAEMLHAAFARFKPYFDPNHGGTNKAPKFPMPCMWMWTLNYSNTYHNANARNQLKITLDRMATGGIFDIVHGGFARYSTDAEWFAPHFEKMLYDNGQLLSLYAKAHASGIGDYQSTIQKIIAWLKDEMTHPQGGFYSSYDADSEGVEGLYYCHTWQQLSDALTSDELHWAAAYWHLLPEGNWEHGLNILHATQTDEAFATDKGVSYSDWIRIKDTIIQKLKNIAKQRVKPGLDDKIITSWNALAIIGLCDGYRYTDHTQALNMAIQAEAFIHQNMVSDVRLLHQYSKNETQILGFLDDYAWYSLALIRLYLCTAQEDYLHRAKALIAHAVQIFKDDSSPFFYYTSSDAQPLIARKKELFDNVIPSSNAAMAEVLITLGRYFYEDNWITMGKAMVSHWHRALPADVRYLGHWASLALWLCQPHRDLVIAAPNDEIAQSLRAEADRAIYSGVIAYTYPATTLPLAMGKQMTGANPTLYVCTEKECLPPVYTIEQALSL